MPVVMVVVLIVTVTSLVVSGIFAVVGLMRSIGRDKSFVSHDDAGLGLDDYQQKQPKERKVGAKENPLFSSLPFNSIYALQKPLEDIDGNPIDISKFAGRTALVMNVASE